MNDLVLDFFDNATDALLICQRQKDSKTSTYEVKAINQRAKSILAWTGTMPPSISLEQIIPSQVLLHSLDAAYTSGTRQAGTTELLTLPDAKTPFAFEVKSLNNSLLIQLKKQAGEVLVAQALGEHLLSTSLTCVVVFEAVRDEQGQVEDLRLVFQNQAARDNPFLGLSAELGQLMSEWYPQTRELGQFNKYLEVIETGTPFVSEKYYPDKDQTFQTAVSRYGDGVVISYYNLTEKLLAERKAQQQVHFQQQIIDSSQDAIILWDPVYDTSGEIVDLKAAMFNQAALYGGMFSEDNYRQLTLIQISPGAIEYMERYAGVLKTGKPVRLERYNRRGNQELWMEISASRLGDRLMTIIMDITEFKKATIELQAQYELLDGILNSSDNYILVSEAIRDENNAIIDFRFTKANQITIEAFQQIFGFNAVGYSVKELVGDRPDLLKDALAVMETGKSHIVENWKDPISGKWLKASMHKLNNGIVATYVDVTRIQEALVEARHQTGLVQGVLDSSINGVYAMEILRDEHGKIVDFKILMTNQAGVLISNLPYEKIINNTYLTLFPIVQEVGFFERYVEAIETGRPFRTEVSFPSPDRQTIFWFDLSMTQTANGLVILTFMDITQQVLLRQKQETLLEALRLSNRNLEQFAYVASHDLQEPTRKIKSFGDLLLKQYGSVLPPAGADLVTRMQSASNRMQELIAGLLTYSRFSNQKEQPEVVSLTPIVQAVLGDLDLVIRDKKAEVLVGQLPSVLGNPTQLHQLFQNLITNALKFSNEPTPPLVTIEAGPATGPEIREASVAPEKQWLAIRITDNGIGIEEANRHRIFDLFVRLHGRSHYSGHGLGLAICKKVVELHGGGITVFSAPEQGTTFVVVLPVL
ncbi:ATP-binding protein [Telluribacter sp.]|jgi:signal transduction histidine kinase|uniref:ATP-binding protein n=1 Tax=Telluribacter sp. TaxID=1978767 RepID=UPI002E12843C|nr:ATP-binding protein [Telluribacter sp.]